MSSPSRWQHLPTEAINPKTLGIDTLSARGVVDLIGREDRRVLAAVHKEHARIAKGAEMIAAALGKGGRLFFVGAGTSGRLGVIEAAEIPPTFGTSPSIVQALIAGGEEAVFRAREGVEDNFDEGARLAGDLAISRRDVMVGISASGITPFVRGALTTARARGARLIFVTCWPGTDVQKLVHLMIAPTVGPEVVTGSTRLKAGTATKMVLNMLTTTAMILIGKTYGNLMVDLRTGSDKLKDRARRIVAMVTGATTDEAGDLLLAAEWNVKAAIVMKNAGVSYAGALGRLTRAKGSMRRALGEDLEPRLKKLIRPKRT